MYSGPSLTFKMSMVDLVTLWSHLTGLSSLLLGFLVTSCNYLGGFILKIQDPFEFTGKFL